MRGGRKIFPKTGVCSIVLFAEKLRKINADKRMLLDSANTVTHVLTKDKLWR